MIILNLILLLLNMKQDEMNYTLSAEEENNIKNVLAESNIFLYTTLPEEFKPMKSVKMVRRTIDNQAIIKHFLKDIDNVKKPKTNF